MFELKNKKIFFFFLFICLIQLFYIFNFRSGFKFDVFKDPFSINSGVMYALPIEAIELKKIINDKNISKFNLSKKLQKDNLIYQRIIEYTYPNRFDNLSKYFISYKNEKVDNKCKLNETFIYLKLSEC